MWRHSCLHLWKRPEVRDGQIECFRICRAANWRSSSGTFTNMWRAYEASWYRPRIITCAPSNFSTAKYTFGVGFQAYPVTQSHSFPLAGYRARFVTNSEDETCWTHKLQPLNNTCLTNFHVEIGIRKKNGNLLNIAGRMEMQIDIFGNLSLWKAICVFILIHVSGCLKSVKKLWDMMIFLCMCNGQTSHVNILCCILSWLTTDDFGIICSVRVKCERYIQISNEIYYQHIRQYCHTSHGKGG